MHVQTLSLDAWIKFDKSFSAVDSPEMQIALLFKSPVDVRRAIAN